jgi:hypothetical protein
MSALFTILVIAAASAETTADQWTWDDGERSMQLIPSTTVMDEGEALGGTLFSDGDASLAGKILWSPEAGRLYAQGYSDQGGWVIDGQCAAWGEGYLCATGWGRVGSATWGRVSDAVWDGASEESLDSLMAACYGHISGTSMACPSAVSYRSGEALAYWQPSKTGAEPAFLTVGGNSFFAELNGQFLPIKVKLTSTSDASDEEMDLEITLEGIFDTGTDTMSLSWAGGDSAMLQEAACSFDEEGGMSCVGAALMWDGHYGDGNAPSFWGYEHMTTVKGL